MASIKDILSMPLEVREAAYKANGIDVVTIDGNEFRDYGAFSFLWEKSYVKSPVRSGDGSIGNLNSYATFLTPHLKIDFSLMSIDSYRTLMGLIYLKNEFTVTCYDIVNNSTTTNRMYFSTEEMPKLWTIAHELNSEEDWVELVGVQDYVVEMIGTNVSPDVINILYYDEDDNLIPDASQNSMRGEDFIVNYNYTAKRGYRFDGEWFIGYSDSIVRNGDVMKANVLSTEYEIILRAKTVPTNEYKLSFDFGNGETLVNRATGEPIYEVPIKQGQTIGAAISSANIYLTNGNSFSFPRRGTGAKTIEVDGEYYTPYYFSGWYINTNLISSFVQENTIFDQNKNITIYQKYEPNVYTVNYIDNTHGVISFDSLLVSYGDNVPMPTPRIDGRKFGGWFTDSGFTQSFDGVMTPYDLDLYAKWEGIDG